RSSDLHRQRNLCRKSLIDAPAWTDDHCVSGGDGERAATVDRKIFKRSEAGAVARRVSTAKRRDAAGNRRAMLSGADGGKAAKLRGAGALHAERCPQLSNAQRAMRQRLVASPPCLHQRRITSRDGFPRRLSALRLKRAAPQHRLRIV